VISVVRGALASLQDRGFPGPVSLLGVNQSLDCETNGPLQTVGVQAFITACAHFVPTKNSLEDTYNIFRENTHGSIC
jgi:hypothetical protein